MPTDGTQKKSPVQKSFVQREMERRNNILADRGLRSADPDAIKELPEEHQEIARNGHLVHKLKAKDSTGKTAYYFVYVRKTKERAFLEAIKRRQSIDLEDYGQVIASCYGEEPSEHVRKILREKYRFEA